MKSHKSKPTSSDPILAGGQTFSISSVPLVLLALLASSLSLVGCTTDDHRQNPDELREKTAQATAEVKSDVKAVAQGVRDGLTRDKDHVDLNTATKDQLIGIGLTRAQSDHVIAHRPYASTHELLTKHVLSEDEYKTIEPHVRVDAPSNQ
jgi:DNA uptake protein ComE-like DNA-binding protein